MQVLKEGIDRKIREGFVKELLLKGYERASLRNTSDYAGISVGNIYHYYKSKMLLFDAVVEEALLEISKMNHALNNRNQLIQEKGYEGFVDFTSKIVSEFLVKYANEMAVLLYKSASTRYENYKDTVVEGFSQNFKKSCNSTIEEAIPFQKDFVITMVMRNFIDNIGAVALTNKDEEWVRETTKIVVKHHLKSLLALYDELGVIV